MRQGMWLAKMDGKLTKIDVCIWLGNTNIVNTAFKPIVYSVSGAYISENSTHYYLLDSAYLGRKLGQNTMDELSDHKIKAIFELSTLEKPYIDSLFVLIYEFYIFFNFYFLELSV